MTHAFFKGLLFLGAGSVMHAMDNEQDMRKMGGLWRHMPRTYGTFLVSTLAIAGIPIQVLGQERLTGEAYLAYLRAVVERLRTRGFGG